MKKLVVYFLLAAMLLAACSETKDPVPAGTQPSAPESVQGPTENAPETEPPVETKEPEVTTDETVTVDPIVVASAELPAGYTIKQIGTISDGDAVPRFRSDDIIIYREKGNGGEETFDYLLNEVGQRVSEEPYKSISRLFGNYYQETLYSDDVNATGLVTSEGKIVIPYETAFLKTMSALDKNTKFIRAVFSTGVTKNEDEAFFFVTDRSFAISYQEGDELHTGYAKIFNLETGKFLDLVITDPSSIAVRACGDYLCVEDGEGYKIYDGNGTVTFEITHRGYVECGWNYLVVQNYENNTEMICGADGTVYYTTENTLTAISENFIQETVYTSSGRTKTIRDIYGNLVMELGDADVYAEHFGVFHIKEGELNKLVDQFGNELLSTAKYLNHRGYGCWSYSEDVNGNYVYYLCLPTGTLVECEYLDNLVATKKVISDQKNCYVFADGDFTLGGGKYSPNVLAEGLVSICGENGYGVFDLFSGEQLLPQKYRQIYTAYGNVYALLDGVWQVFEITLK